MRIGIDASNIRAGGGLAHLVGLLRHVQPDEHGIERITVWGGQRTLKRLPEWPWLRLAAEPMLDSPLPQRLFWQVARLTQLAEGHCDALFVPGGAYTGSFRPFVTMSQNMLPFDVTERRRYGLSWMRLRFLLLERVQSLTFQLAAGVIFLTETARRIIEKRIGRLRCPVATIPHGVDERFRCEPRVQEPLAAYSLGRPFRWLYVSIVNLYKHQWHVAEAAAIRRRKGDPIALDLVGPAYQPALVRLERTMHRLDPAGQFIRYRGPVPHSQVAEYDRRADGFVFASTCEAFAQVLLEVVASGLPIACSDRGPMPEVLGDSATVYFDPERPEEIAQALHCLMSDHALRERLAWSAYERAQAYSWARCARETFSFLVEAAQIDGSRISQTTYEDHTPISSEA
jgi:glycosyltransferase involved in cell wall biosynthesis